METDEFWTIIETARAATDKPFSTALTDVLAELSLERILEYDERFAAVHESVYRWDVWAASYLISGWFSDDGFIDFRTGLISLGQEWFERVATAPDSIVDPQPRTGAGWGRDAEGKRCAVSRFPCPRPAAARDYLRTRNRKTLVSPTRLLLTGSRSVLARPGVEKRTPSPSRTGRICTTISSTSPRRRHCPATSAPRI